MRTELGYGIVLNKQSTMKREWISATDSMLPVEFAEPVGITTRYRDHYEYAARIPLIAKDSIVALEIRFIVFDVWGELIRTLSATEIRDLPPGRILLEPAWNLFSENEASEFYASIGYVARVRTSQGRVLEADPTPIVLEAQKFSKKFTPEDLEPKAPNPNGRSGKP